MLASRSLLTASRLDASAELTDFLIQAGFIDQEASGIYSYTTLGALALDRLEQALHTALQRAGAVQWQLALLQAQSHWEKTGRAQDYGQELMSVKLRSGALMRLSATAEEQLTHAIAARLRGRHVDHWIYQLGHKWRDETRARGGLVRSREFRMMDAYHFAQEQEAMVRGYEVAKHALVEFLQTLGCRVRVVSADCGEIGGMMSEELQVETELSDDGWLEVGHCFMLGQRYAQAFDFKCANGQYAWMSCHGLGTSRLLAVLLASRRSGIRLWGDESFAVLDDVIVAIGQQARTQERAAALMESLKARGHRVLWEDRFDRAGQSLAASEACGARWRWVVSDRLGNGVAERTNLATGQQERVVLQV